MADLKFTRTHEWLQYDAEEAIIGISDHAQGLLGDLVFIEMPEEGKQVNAGDELGVIESVKAAADFYAPVSGTVLSVNQEAAASPALVNSDPYGQGWLVKIQPNNPAELNNLLTADQYDNEIKG